MKKRRYVRTIAAATLALALTGCAGQAETDDQRAWLNAAEGQATTVVTQEAVQPTEATTIPTEPTLPEETQIPETTEVQKMQQETTEVTVPLPAETEPLNEETSPPETVPPAPPPTFQTEPEETVQPETQYRETEPPETIPKETEPPETIPKEKEPPETEPMETAPPETEPEPESSGDIYSAAEAMAVGNSYAASAYGMTVSPELGLGNRTVLSGQITQNKDNPSQSLQMMQRPLMTADELKSMPKGSFVVMKTGSHPVKVKLKLFFEWGIKFEKPLVMPDRGSRPVYYAGKSELEAAIIAKYPLIRMESVQSPVNKNLKLQQQKSANLKTKTEGTP